MSDVPPTPTHRPTRVASGLAVLAAAGAVAAVATLPGQRAAILVALVAVAGIAAGDVFVRTDDTAVGWGLVCGGVVLAVASLGIGVGFTTGYTPRAELLPGLIGVVLVGIGVLGLERVPSRRLVSAGVAFVLSGIVLSGLVRGAQAPGLLAGAAAAVVAWDAGEHAIGLGEQLGREARTWPVELVHVASTGLVGASAGAGALVLAGLVGTRRVPLVGLVAMLAAALVLLVALYRQPTPAAEGERRDADVGPTR